MQAISILTIALSAFALTAVASAQTGSGSLGVSVTVEASLSLIFMTDTNGADVAGTATSTASLPFGTVSLHGGSVSDHLTKAMRGAALDVSTPFDIRVDLANSPSTTYTLRALLATADTTNTWLIGTIDISGGTLSTLTATGAYTTNVPYTLHLTVPSSAPASLISNSIAFTAIPN